MVKINGEASGLKFPLNWTKSGTTKWDSLYYIFYSLFKEINIFNRVIIIKKIIIKKVF